jgi:peptide deformylase
MAILKIARMGHPVLRRRADEISDPTDPLIRQLAADMVETMLDAGGVGLAAPQVHFSQRLIVFHVPDARSTGQEGDSLAGVTALVNPVIEPIGDVVGTAWEGCLSIPGLRGAVPRYDRIRYRGVTPEGEAVAREATGFHARVVQHEVDHLEGVLYLDRMPDLKLLSFNEELRHFVQPA